MREGSQPKETPYTPGLKINWLNHFSVLHFVSSVLESLSSRGCIRVSRDAWKKEGRIWEFTEILLHYMLFTLIIIIIIIIEVDAVEMIILFTLYWRLR